MASARASPDPGTRTRLAFSFGPRFFLILLVGLVWLGPGWIEPRFLFAMVLWDVLALGVWAWDLLRLPRPAQLELRRIWNAPAALGSPSRIEIELINAARVSISRRRRTMFPRR